MQSEMFDYWTKDDKGEVVKLMPAFDPVQKPFHYNQGSIECIDYIKQVLGKEGFIAYCRGNAMKYQHRAGYKGSRREDTEKAQYYTNKAIETMKEIENGSKG